MRNPHWSRHRYTLVRREHKVPIAFNGRVLVDGERPGTVVGCQGCNYVYVRLEDRIDKAEIRISVKRLTFLDEYVTQPEPATGAKQKRVDKVYKETPRGFETYWL